MPESLREEKIGQNHGQQNHFLRQDGQEEHGYEEGRCGLGRAVDADFQIPSQGTRETESWMTELFF